MPKRRRMSFDRSNGLRTGFATRLVRARYDARFGRLEDDRVTWASLCRIHTVQYVVDMLTKLYDRLEMCSTPTDLPFV